jgi:hypothetical protein
MELPPAVQARLRWPDGLDAATIVTRPPFERANRGGPGVTPIYALRLGNAAYPHMKMQLQPWPNSRGFLLSVNTHDHVNTIEEGSAEAIAYHALQAENQKYKEQIEHAWDEAGLPTFLRYLREYVQSQTITTDDADGLASGGPTVV